jgi:hypothetical protein
MSAVLAIDASETYDAHRFPHLLQDYEWAVHIGLLPPPEAGWRSWIEGYEAGEKIALRVVNRGRRGGG